MTVKEATTAQLIQQLGYAKKFVEDTNKKIGGTGGWIAREANWEEVARAKNEIEIIEQELKLR